LRRPPLGRLAVVLVAFLVALTGILARLTLLQVRDARAYQSLARNQRVRTIELPSDRGAILDRDGHDLALSLEAKDLYANPRYVLDPESTASALAPILHIAKPVLLADLSSDASFVYIARGVSLGTAERVERLDLPGIGFLDGSRRYYPNGPLAAQVLGFVGVDHTGLSGLELEYQSQLAGRPGHRVIEMDPTGRPIPQGVSRDLPPQPGEGVVTTIDREIQYRTQLALRAAVRENKAKSGTVIVMDPRSGQILAMATWPWFDPNHFADVKDTARLQNPAITSVYEPGSVIKGVTASAVVEEHAFPLRKAMLVPDQWRLGDHVFHDSHTHPPMRMTLADIISESSNIGTMRVAMRLGTDRLASYLARFGFGQPTGVGFPGEQPGILPSLDQWTTSSMGTIPVGQGLAVTSLQVAAAYGAIANRGVWTQPSLVRGFVDQAGRFRSAPPPVRRRVISSRTARTVGRMLAYVVDSGTGTEAQIPGYWVAGKTGTAMIPKADGVGYSSKFIASFVGFAPAERPRVLVEAVLDEPVTEYGAIAAAPLFRTVARYALTRLRIPPAERPALPPHVLPYP
jgi:cell division protein FtsI (penicillin-binding protein 3)